jgi:GNAT superfamily N-acetyltransferase
MELHFQDRLTDDQIADLVLLYQSEWWTNGRQEADVRQMLRHCDLIVAITEAASGRLLGFARVLTDFVYKALIFDVIVDTAYRSQGLGRKLMEAVVNHQGLQSVKHLELYCLPEMVPYCERWGFTSELGKLRLMRLVHHHAEPATSVLLSRQSLHEGNRSLDPLVQPLVILDTCRFNRYPARHRPAGDVELPDGRLLQGVPVFVRVEADDQRLLPDAHAHVAVQQEAVAAKQLLLGDALRAGQGLADAFGQGFVEGHPRLLPAERLVVIRTAAAPPSPCLGVRRWP